MTWRCQSNYNFCFTLIPRFLCNYLFCVFSSYSCTIPSCYNLCPRNYYSYSCGLIRHLLGWNRITALRLHIISGQRLTFPFPFVHHQPRAQLLRDFSSLSKELFSESGISVTSRIALKLKPDNELSNAQSWRWMLRDNQSHLWAHRSLSLQLWISSEIMLDVLKVSENLFFRTVFTSTFLTRN